MKKRNTIERLKIKNFNLEKYFMLVMLICLMMGIGMFMYCILFEVNLSGIWIFTDPLFYLGNGFTAMICFLLQKKYCFFGNI